MIERSLLDRLGRLSAPDFVFLPAYTIVIIALVWFALSWRPMGAEPVVDERGFTMAGQALSQLIPGPGTASQFIVDFGEQPVARLSAEASIEAAGTLSAGVGAVLSAEFEERVIGRMLRIEVEMRAGPDFPSEGARLGYFTIGHGDSGWRPIEVTDAWSVQGFCFQVSADAVANNNEAVGIWPDVTGAGGSVIVREIRAIIEPEGQTREACEAQIGAPS